MQIQVPFLIFLLMAMPLAAADSPYPEPLATALASAVPTNADARNDWRFHVAVYSEDGPILARYDGDGSDGTSWTLLNPTEPELTESQRAIWEETRSVAAAGETESGLFFTADAAEIIAGDVRLVAESDDHLIYSFSPYLGPETMDAAIARNLVGEITVRRSGPMIEQIRLHAPQRFRAQMVIRIDAFEMVMQFTQFEDFAVPVMSRIASTIDGRAAFQHLSERTEMTFSEIEYLGSLPIRRTIGHSAAAAN